MPSTTREDRQSYRPHHHLHPAANPPPSSIGGSQKSTWASLDGPDPRLPPLPPITQSSSNVSSSALNFSRTLVSSDQQRRQSTSHRRSNSLSGFKDGIGNLNRWSQSTTSSKGSTSHKRSNSFSRRMSLGGSGAFAIGLPTFQGNGSQSPSKLQKQRPQVAGNVYEGSSNGQFDGPSDPSTSLPPIITIPSLNTRNNGTSPLTAANSTPSTAGLLSAAVRSAVPDYFNQSWEGNTGESSQTRSTSKVRTPGGSVSSVMNSSSAITESPVRRQRQDRERSRSRGHSRNKSQAEKGSSGTVSSDKSRDRTSKPPSQKAMLSKALQKANTAVVLDNAQNYEGAMEAYAEACDLLQQVMNRSSGEEDKRKLEAIRNTYTNRIMELEKIAPELLDDGKALPARPESTSFRDEELTSSAYDDRDSAVIGTALVTRIVNDDSFVSGPQSGIIPASQVPRRRDSLLPSPFTSNAYRPTNNSSSYPRSRSISKSPMNDRGLEIDMNLAPMDRDYMPPPLSPRPLIQRDYQESSRQRNPPQGVERGGDDFRVPSGKTHQRAASNESMSWLDTIDESIGSTASSVHSRTSSLAVRRKHIRAASGDTEAEFDAALDAAVEAAYDDGFEPEEPRPIGSPVEAELYDDDDIVADVRRRVELARERVRQTEREAAIQLARDREKSRRMRELAEQTIDIEDEGSESDEEERMLEEMTKDYVMDEFEFGLQSKPAVPRESDSSGFSGRTWNSSIGSNPTTAGTSLSTVAETSVPPEMPLLASKMRIQPAQASSMTTPSMTSKNVPPPTLVSTLEAGNNASLGSNGVRSRRLSGQNAKELKIETASRATPFSGVQTQIIPKSPIAAPSNPPPPLPIASQTGGIPPQSRLAVSNPPLSLTAPAPSSRQTSSPLPGPSPSEVVSPPTPTLAPTYSNENDLNGAVSRTGSPARAQSRSGLRKNFSSSSLKNIKGRNLSVSNIDDGSDLSPSTPIGNSFNGNSAKDAAARMPAMPTLPTPIATAFRDKMSGVANGGLYLFNNDINSPDSPGSPNSVGAGAPIPLEPCPVESLLRPFWLMRALYQTIAHPRGGYLSTKLFVPRDVWRVKGVKIKCLEDKVACCDFLTAALLKLSKVDECDADAVLEEMQLLEGVIEQVQQTLGRKLGSEVGVQASGMLFKDAPAINEADSNLSISKTPTSSTKSSFSWRRLRTKNSGTGLAASYSAKPSSAEGQKEGLTMATVPMTSLTSIRFAKRDVSQVQFSGPNSTYMGSLAKLFDAVQVIDQIARQVEDPGLRHADKTQVGLELSTRHAAEFFGFYICRFVLTDLSLMLDKFIKRGSEWVLM